MGASPESLTTAVGRPGVSRCPNCAATCMEPFYEANGVPAHSVRLMHTSEEAIAYPRGDVRLAFCQSCGFITNTAFDVSLNRYSTNFEETQHFSPRFDAWARRLVERLVHDYDIRQKQIVEIGCGKGEFLALLCEAGDNRGIGIDPGCISGRLGGHGAAKVRLIQDLYSDKYADLPADLVCCRHTLEHIQPTHEFMHMVRSVIGSRTETLVFFEVPDMRRVLRERAFWDVYYEHCSYFTAGSLARLFRSAGFGLLELARDFEDQYLWLVARPVTGRTLSSFSIEDDLHEIQADVDLFKLGCPQDIATWRHRIERFAAEGKKPVLWGAGSKAVALLTTAGIGESVQYLVDINPYKAGKFLPGTGHLIVAPDFLKGYRPGVVVAMNTAYADEIARTLAAMNVRADVVTL